MKTRGDERGQALVEFALVLPLLLAVVTAIAEFGIAFKNYMTIADAARAGARVAAVSSASTDPVGDARAAAIAAAQDLNPPPTVATTPSTAPWTAGSPVTVTVSYGYRIGIFGLTVYSGTLRSSTTERVE
jgi:Flp pilus assembly protein TadG